MENAVKYIIMITSFMTIELTVTESRNETKPHNDRRYYQNPAFMNVCKMNGVLSKIRCYCNTSELKLATRADCWIFNGVLTENDPIWPTFSSQSELEVLLFNVRFDDALTFIPAKVIVRLNRLKHLSIEFATIEKIPPYAFTNSSTIRQIMLKSNKIIDIEKHSFSQLMMLSNVSLDENQISEIKRDVFFNVPNLHILHISYNNISLLHEGCFKHLNNLIELKLDFNFISVVTKEMLDGLENLSRLNMSNNKLTMIGNLAFSDLWGLKDLMLDNNAIEYISERAFSGLPQLKKLSLSGNKLVSIYENTFEGIRSLSLLDLRYNLLPSVSYETIRRVIENDKTVSSVVYLQGNPFECNCRLTWIYIVRNETKDNSLKQALEQITCVADSSNLNQLDVQNEEETGNRNTLGDDNYEYYDKYDNYNENEKAKVNNAKLLTAIPLKSLPCPKEIIQFIEETYGHPIQNEIRAKALSHVLKNIPSLLLIPIMVVLLF